MIWLHAPNIDTKHGFSTRHGGISATPFNSLNLGGHEDRPEYIQENRKIALNQLGIDRNNIALLKQVHGNEVIVVNQPGCKTGDALVTKEKNIALVVSIADCYPLLFHDPVNGIVGAVHAGWRGTRARIVESTLTAMQRLGAENTHIRVAIGQGIGWKNFEVGDEVHDQFTTAGFPEDCFSGKHLNLIHANQFLLLEHGIKPENIWVMNRCTTESDFFSYRRDKGKTGRMWALISL